MPLGALRWWPWFALWRTCMWVATRVVSNSLTWHNWAHYFARRCRAAGGPSVTGVVSDDPPRSDL